MSKFWESEKFKKLNAEWRNALRESGFEDKEQEDGNLKEWHSLRFTDSYYTQSIPHRESYYRLAGQFLYHYQFRSDEDKTIWKFHSEGKSLEYIDNITKNTRGKARRVVDRLKKAMKTFKYHG